MDCPPLVSIVIPTRNRRELLEQTLASVQGQTYPHWQAIVVDDGSSDQTDAMIHSRFGGDPRIQYRQRHGSRPGANVCRNEGFAASVGQYVLFLDSDDLLAPSCLQRRMAAIQAQVELDFVVAYAEYFQFQPGDLHRVHNIATDQHPIDRFLLLDYPWQTSSLLWRRAALGRVGPWDERLPSWQDWELHLRALIGGVQYRWLPTVDFYIRIARADDGSISQQQSRSPAHLLAAPPLLRGFCGIWIKPACSRSNARRAWRRCICARPSNGCRSESSIAPRVSCWPRSAAKSSASLTRSTPWRSC